MNLLDPIPGRRRASALPASAAILLLAGCASYAPCPVTAPGPGPMAATEIDSTLFLIGDAGEPAAGSEPALAALAAELAAAWAELGAERLQVVFLGDNVYPAGLREPGHRQRRRLEAKLDAQLAALAGESGISAIFAPGNHDWGENAADGRQRLANQAAYLEEHSQGRARLLPEAGCPGPVVTDRGEKLRLIALDTHWWLRQAAVPRGAAGGCVAASEAAVLQQLETALAGRGARHAVVFAHHPLASGGEHGGHGGLRSLGLIPQDLTHRRYRAMKSAFEAVFGRQPPLVYAAGHDHGLQLLRGSGYPFTLVSGAGSTDNLTRVGAISGTLACRSAPGFARLDFARGGRVRLGLFAAAPGGRGREIFAADLAP